MSERSTLAIRKQNMKYGDLPKRNVTVSRSIRSPPDHILFLQRTIGNQAVRRLMKSGVLQAKLRIGAPGDVYEQEADRVADIVMRMPEPQAVSSGTPSIQRACPKCEEGELKRQPIKEEDEEEKLQRKPVEGEEEEVQVKATSGNISDLHPNVESHIRSLKGGVQSPNLTPGTFFRMATHGHGQQLLYKEEMETAFSERFDNVRAYVGKAQPLTMLGARAAMQGTRLAFQDINPSKETVAHELVHVVQQRHHGEIFSSGPATLSEPGEPTEQEAARLATKVAQGQKVQVKLGANGVIARQAQSPEQPIQKAPALEIPPEIVAEIEAMEARSKGEIDEKGLRHLGQLAVQLIGKESVVALAQQAGVPGAKRRKMEVESESGGTIHRQAGEAAAATAGTMWWLTLVDGPLPIGDIVYGALIIAAAIAASQAIRRCRCTIRYAPPDIMAQCPPRVYGAGVTMHDCQNVAKFTAPQQCRQYYGHCGWMP